MTDSSESTSQNASGADASGERRGDASGGSIVPKGLRRAVRAVTNTVLGLLVLLGVVLVVLQTDSGATATVRFLTERVNPLPGTEITVDGASGTWLGNIRLTGVTLTRVDSASGERLQMARVDTLAASYRLLPLLTRNRLHVTRLDVRGPSVTLRQAADASWDWVRLLPPSDPADTTGTLAYRVDEARLDRGAMQAKFYAEGRDSTASVRDARTHLRDLRLDDTVTATLDTLGLTARLPGDDADLRLSARAALLSDRLRLDTLRLTSPRSDLRGHGRIRLPDGPGDDLDDTSLNVRAAPLSFRDLDALAPTLGLDAQESVRFDLSVTGDGPLLTSTLDARFEDGGRVTATAEGTPRAEAAPDGPPLRYRLDASIQRLTTSLLAPRDTSQNRLTADVAASLSGPSLRALDGSAQVTVARARLYGLSTDSTRLGATVRDGEARLDATGTVNRASIQAQGRVRPFDDRPSYALTAQLRNVNASAFAPDLGVSTRLQATLALRGSGTSAEDAEADVQVDLGPSTVGAQPVDTGTIRVRLRPDQVQADAGLAVPGGSLRARGQTGFGSAETFRLDTLRVESVNVAALVGDTTQSALTASARLNGQGFDPETMRLDGRVRVDSARYDRFVLETTTASTTLRRGTLTATTDGVLNGGSVRADVRGKPFADTPSLELSGGRFERINLGALAGASLETSLNGDLNARLQGTTPETMQISATLQMDSSRVNRQTVSSGTLNARLQNGAATVEGQLVLPEGRASWAASARPFAQVPAYRVSSLRFDNVDVGALSGTAGLTTALSGEWTLDGSGQTAETLTLTSALRLSPSTVNRAQVSGAQVDVRSDAGAAELSGRVDFADGGRIRLSGAADSLTTTPRVRAQANVGAFDAGAVAGLDTTTSARVDTLQWAFEGRGTSLDDFTGSTRFATGPVTYDQIRIRSSRLNGDLRNGRLRLDTLSVQSNVFDAGGSGVVAYADTTTESDLRAVVGVTNLRPLQPLLGAERLDAQRARAVFNVYGSARTIRFDGEATLNDFAYDDVRLSEAELQFSGRQGDGPFGIARGDVEVTTGLLSLPTASLQSTSTLATIDSSGVRVDASMRIDNRRRADFSAQYDPRTDDARVTLTRADVKLGPDAWSLLQDASVSFESGYRIRNFLLYSEGQQIAADGVIDPNGTQQFITTIEGVQVRPFAELLGYEGLGGQVTGVIDLSGPADAPRLDGSLRADVKSRGTRVGTLTARAAYDSLSLSVNASLKHESGDSLRARGTLPLDLRLDAPTPSDVLNDPVRLELSTDRLTIDWLDPFLDPSTAQQVAGRVQAQVLVEGTRAAPELSGTASLREGSVNLPLLGVRYRDARADVSLNGEVATIDTSIVRSENGGRLQATGTVNFPELTLGEYDVDLTARNFIAIDTRAYRRAIVDGSLALSGTTSKPVLTGTVRVRNADIYFAEATEASASEVAEVALTEEDRLQLERRFNIRVSDAEAASFDAYEALQMDMEVLIRSDTWLRSDGTPSFDIQFTGDLDLTKEADADAQVFGEIQVVSSRSTVQFNQTFSITEGALTFNGNPETPFLDVTAEYQPRSGQTREAEVTITLTLQGRPESLEPKLNSEPTMTTRDILSYLATGRPASEVAGGGGGDLATETSIGIASNFVENLASSRLGLDVVRIDYSSEYGSFLTVGRYVTPRLFASIQQPANLGGSSADSDFTAPNVTLEYQLTNALLLQALTEQSSNVQLNLLFQYTY